MRTVLLLAMVLTLQVGFMIAAYASHVFGSPVSRYLGFAIWIVLPLGVACAACTRLLTKSRWIRSSRQRDTWTVGLSIVLSVLALYAGMFFSINTFGE